MLGKTPSAFIKPVIKDITTVITIEML